MRLQKFLARAGIASRRASEAIILEGRVRVNGEVITELGAKVAPGCIVEVDGRKVELPDETVVIMLNKPTGYVTTMKDQHGRPTVAELVPAETYAGLFPVGRLDQNTTGILLFTNDGELGNLLLHPKHHVPKRYIAQVEGKLSQRELQQLKNGVELEDGKTQPAHVKQLATWQENGRERQKLAITIREGKKRQVKRMCEAVGHKVLKLHREQFGNLTLGSLKQGDWRLLTREEIESLRNEADD